MGERTVDVELPAALDGQRVDRVVALVAEVSRSTAADLVATGRVLLDGAPPERASQKVTAGSRLLVHVVDPDRSLVPEPGLDVPLVHTDDTVLVVDKPAGMVVHPGSGVQEGTLVHGLLARFPELAAIGSPEDRPGIVHRLDKGTSGLLMVARTAAARESLTAQLQARSVDREYLALVLGDMESDRGVIDAPLGRSPSNALRRAVVTSGRPARTTYEVVHRFGAVAGRPPLTLMRCRLETGRTHQIRAHLEAIGHPVVGDETYRGQHRRPALDPGPGRPFLHAGLLGFDHPVSGQRLRFASPLPADLAAVLVGLGLTTDDIAALTPPPGTRTL